MFGPNSLFLQGLKLSFNILSSLFSECFSRGVVGTSHTLCLPPNQPRCSVAQLCPTLCDPMDCSTPGFPVLHHLPEFVQAHVHRVMPSNHLILCHSLLLPSIFPSIRVLSNELALRIRWPKYWSFSFSISPSNESSGLISFRTDWFDLLAVQGMLKSLLQHHSSNCRAHLLQAKDSSVPFNRLGLPWWSSGYNSMLSMRGARV